MLARTIRRISGRAYVLYGTWRTLDETNYQPHRLVLAYASLRESVGEPSRLGYSSSAEARPVPVGATSSPVKFARFPKTGEPI